MGSKMAVTKDKKSAIGHKDLQNNLVLLGVNLIDGVHRELQRDMTILVEDGRITSISAKEAAIIPRNAKIIELSGKTCIPGMIDAHVHLSSSGVYDFMKHYAESMTTKLRRNAYITLKSGVTTVRNMPGGSGHCVMRFRDKVRRGKVLSPRILNSGPALAPPYGYFSLKRYFPFNSVMLTSLFSHIFGADGLAIDVDSEIQAKKAVQKLKKNGVDFIKTVTPGAHMPFIERSEELKEELLKLGMKPNTMEASMKQEVLEAIVFEAHKVGLKVAVHNVCWPEGFKAAVLAGVDSIEHTPLGLLDEETLNLMKEKDIYWVPTGYTFLHWTALIDHPEAFDQPEMKELIPEPFHSLGKRTLQKDIDGIRQGTNPVWKRFYEEMPLYKKKYFPENLQGAISKNIKIVAGVDCGAAGAGYVPHGQLYKELKLFVDNGMDELEAILTATRNAAELLGVEQELGSIEIGKIGDFVVLDANPLEDISNLKRINLVIKDGVIVYNNTNSE